MTVGGASGSPAVFQGEAADRGGAEALTPYPRFPAAMPPRVGGIGRERYLQNPWRGGIPVAWQMHLGVTHGGRQGRGRALTPSPTFPAAAIPPCVEGTSREGICKIHGEAGSQWLGECISGSHTGAARGGDGVFIPFPIFPAAAIRPRVGGTGRERYLQNPWRGVIPVAGRMHLGVTHGGRKRRGRGLDPLTWASRYRRGGLPIRSSEGGRSHMGQGGI